jgi:hypothetical protein
MPRTPTSDLEELLKLLRRILVLAVGAYGLAREMPYITLAARLAILWAILYVSCGLIDVVFRRLSFNAQMRSDTTAAAPNNLEANLPAANERHTG